MVHLRDSSVEDENEEFFEEVLTIAAEDRVLIGKDEQGLVDPGGGRDGDNEGIGAVKNMVGRMPRRDSMSEDVENRRVLKGVVLKRFLLQRVVLREHCWNKQR